MSRYSQLYIERGRPYSDGERARARLYAVFDNMLHWQHRLGVEFLVRSELGINIEKIKIEILISKPSLKRVSLEIC